MDIGRPNNFPRILDLFGRQYEDVKSACWGASFTDAETEEHMRKIHRERGYVMCPHTAVGHLAMQEFAKRQEDPFTAVTVATAHPAKFADDVVRILGQGIEVPQPLQDIMIKTPRVHVMPPTLSALVAYLDETASCR